MLYSFHLLLSDWVALLWDTGCWNFYCEIRGRVVTDRDESVWIPMSGAADSADDSLQIWTGQQLFVVWRLRARCWFNAWIGLKLCCWWRLTHYLTLQSESVIPWLPTISFSNKHQHSRSEKLCVLTGFNTWAWGRSVRSSHVLPVPTWVVSGFLRLLTQFKDVHVPHDSEHLSWFKWSWTTTAGLTVSDWLMIFPSFSWMQGNRSEEEENLIYTDDHPITANKQLSVPVARRLR